MYSNYIKIIQSNAKYIAHNGNVSFVFQFLLTCTIQFFFWHNFQNVSFQRESITINSSKLLVITREGKKVSFTG